MRGSWSCGVPLGVADDVPGDIWAKVFGANGAIRCRLDSDADALAKLLLDANGFAQKPDRCACTYGKFGLLI